MLKTIPTIVTSAAWNIGGSLTSKGMALLAAAVDGEAMLTGSNAANASLELLTALTCRRPFF